MGCCECPRQQVGNAIDWMIGDAGEDGAEIGLGIDAIQLAGFD